LVLKPLPEKNICREPIRAVVFFSRDGRRIEETSLSFFGKKDNMRIDRNDTGAKLGGKTVWLLGLDWEERRA